MTEQFIERTVNQKVIENGIRNEVRWQWLEEKDFNGDYLLYNVRKLKTRLGLLSFLRPKARL